MILPYKSKTPVQKPSADNSSLYITVFFDTIDSCSLPPFNILSFSSIGSLVHTDECVQNAVIALGAIYVSRKQIDAGFAQSSHRFPLNDAYYTIFRNNALRQLQRANSHDVASVLVCALLLSIAEVTKLYPRYVGKDHG